VKALPLAILLSLTACPKAPLSAQPIDRSVIVVAAGDISAPVLSAQQLTATLVEQQHPAAVLMLGDGQYPEGSLEDYQHNYDPTWGRFKELTWPVPGNHEYKSGGAGYFAYFGARAGDPAKGYYSFDLGQWHLVALNTNHDCLDVACDEDSQQLQWLAADLAKSTKKCTLAFWHHPRFNSGSHGNFTAAAPIWKLLEKHHVELALNGHEHFYERLGPVNQEGAPTEGGIVQLTVGTGGIGFSDFKDVHPGSVVRRNDTFGVVRLRLGETDWESDFVGVPGSTFVDHASGTCR
jgi:hypothetical protein